jgi:hypothetical protein
MNEMLLEKSRLKYINDNIYKESQQEVIAFFCVFLFGSACRMNGFGESEYAIFENSGTHSSFLCACFCFSAL